MAVVLDYPIGKSALKQEKELLKKLKDATDLFIATLPAGSLGLKIAMEWRGSFKELAGLNQKLVDASSANYKAMLDEEIASSKEFMQFVKASDMGRSWKKYFQSEIDIAKELLVG